MPAIETAGVAAAIASFVYQTPSAVNGVIEICKTDTSHLDASEKALDTIIKEIREFQHLMDQKEVDKLLRSYSKICRSLEQMHKQYPASSKLSRAWDRWLNTDSSQDIRRFTDSVDLLREDVRSASREAQVKDALAKVAHNLADLAQETIADCGSEPANADSPSKTPENASTALVPLLLTEVNLPETTNPMLNEPNPVVDPSSGTGPTRESSVQSNSAGDRSELARGALVEHPVGNPPVEIDSVGGPSVEIESITDPLMGSVVDGTQLLKVTA